MTQPIITTEAELLTALVAIMKRTGEQRSYPKAVIAMSEFVFAHFTAHASITGVDIIAALGTLEGTCSCCGAGQQSALGTLFHGMAGAIERQSYSNGLVELTARVLEVLVPRLKANRGAILLDALELCAGEQTWFEIKKVGRKLYLRTTQEGRQALGFRASVKI